MHVCMHVSMYACTYVYKYICISLYIYIYTDIPVLWNDGIRPPNESSPELKLCTSKAREGQAKLAADGSSANRHRCSRLPKVWAAVEELNFSYHSRGIRNNRASRLRQPSLRFLIGAQKLERGCSRGPSCHVPTPWLLLYLNAPGT